MHTTMERDPATGDHLGGTADAGGRRAPLISSGYFRIGLWVGLLQSVPGRSLLSQRPVHTNEPPWNRSWSRLTLYML